MKKEQIPDENYKTFGAFFPYGGHIHFDKPMNSNTIIIVNIPRDCRILYISTLSKSQFRLGTSPSNLTFSKNLRFCLMNVGQPSTIEIKMNLESFSKLSFLSIDGNDYPHLISHNETSFNTSFELYSLIHFRTTYFYLTNFVNITTKQNPNSIPYEPFSSKINFSITNRKYAHFLQVPLDTSNLHLHQPSDFIKVTLLNHDVVDESPLSEPENEVDDDYDDEQSYFITKMVLITVVMISGALFLGCCGLVAICCCCNKNNNETVNVGNEEDDNFDNAIPPVTPISTQNKKIYGYIPKGKKNIASSLQSPILQNFHNE